MSRLIIIFVVAAILLLSISIAQPEFPDSNYDPETGALKISLKKGWNLIPWTGPSYDFPNTCGEGYGAKNIFVWSPTAKKYLGGTLEQINSPDSEAYKVVVRDSVNRYYYAQEGFGALFALRDSDCSATGRMPPLTKIEQDELGGVLPTFKIPAGWNFITIHPWMMNKNMGDFIGTCEITKAFLFDAERQKWEGGSVASQKDFDTAFITEELVGVTYAMKFADDCSFGLKEEEILGPPPLPE